MKTTRKKTLTVTSAILASLTLEPSVLAEENEARPQGQLSHGKTCPTNSPSSC